MSVKKHSPSQFVDNRINTPAVDISKFVVGETRVVVKPPQGCCGSTICFYENLVTDIGTFKGQHGQETTLLVLENGMRITADDIQYAL